MALFKENLATDLVRVYLHDCDEYVGADSDATFSVGQAQFTFKDFLRPYCRELKLRSDVFPMKRVEVDNTTNLDLNTTARRNEKTVEKFSPYLSHATYFVLQANLAVKLGSFNHEAEMESHQKEEEKKAAAEGMAEEAARPTSSLSKGAESSKSRPTT